MEVAMTDKTEAELEAEIAAANAAASTAQAALDELRKANRKTVLAEVGAQIRKYKITRTELAAYFPQLRKPKSASAAADSTQAKRRGRPKKATD